MQPELAARIISANNAGIAEIRLSANQTPAVYEMVCFPLEVGGRNIQLLGEITEIDGDTAIVQLYEGAEALSAGGVALPTGEPSICQVAPGMPGIRMSGVGSSLDSMPGQHIPRGEYFSPLADLRAGASSGSISEAVHNGLVEVVAAVAGRIGEPRVVLTGGCFQNIRLTEGAIAALTAAGMTPYWHHRVPPNDGGIALGQAVWAAWTEGQGD